MTDLSFVSDHELIRRCAQKEEAALRTLFARHQQMVYHLLYRMLGSRDDADELLPDVFLKIWTGAGQFRARANPVTWIYRIAANACIDRLRRRPALADVSLEEMNEREELSAAPFDPDRRLLLEEEQARLQRGLLALESEDRLLITLYHLQDRSYGEIQEITGLTYTRLKARLFRARQRLREQCHRLDEPLTQDDLSNDSTAITRFQLRPA